LSVRSCRRTRRRTAEIRSKHVYFFFVSLTLALFGAVHHVAEDAALLYVMYLSVCMSLVSAAINLLLLIPVALVIAPSIVSNSVSKTSKRRQ
jgi:uncharacterized oligopeptide transporter (OPT) family protein